jgi:pilus assembly protein CpaB
MLLRIGLFVLMAIGLVGFGIVAWISTSPPSPPPPQAATQGATAVTPAPPPPPAKIMVLVAVHQLRAGTFLKGDDIRAQEFVADLVPHGASADTPASRAQMQGAMLRHSIGEGQAVLDDDVVRTGDHGFLAAVLEPGMRAMTFSLNDVASDWGLIWPGDRVDLILTEQFDAPNTLAGRHFAAETVITDVRVVAVDRDLMQGEMADDAERKGTRTLTVEVSPQEAERLAIAIRLGKLVISLRSATMARQEATGPAGETTWSGDVSHALDQPTGPPEPAIVRVFRGAEDGKEFKF